MANRGVDQDLWQQAQKMAKASGGMSLQDAIVLYKSVFQDSASTQLIKRRSNTLQRVLKELHLMEEATAFLQDKLGLRTAAEKRNAAETWNDEREHHGERHVHLVDVETAKQFQETREEFPHVFSKIDKNGDGKLSLHEINQYIEHGKAETPKQFQKTREEFPDIFSKIDKNGDGTLSLSEIEQCIEQCTQSIEEKNGKNGEAKEQAVTTRHAPTEVDKQWEEKDDKNGEAKEHAVTTCHAQIEVDKQWEEYFGNLFDAMDLDRDGYLSHDELKQYVASRDSAVTLKLGIGEWDDFIRRADADRDGKVDRKDFVAYCHRAMDIGTSAGLLFDAMVGNAKKFLDIDEIKYYEWRENPQIFAVLGITYFPIWRDSVDKDGNGIDREKFTWFLQSRFACRDGKLICKQSVETSSACCVCGSRKRRLGDDECINYASGFCPEGAKCIYSHSPANTYTTNKKSIVHNDRNSAYRT